MTHPVTLFTGQWADLPLEEVAKLASGWGYDGLELACWGDHLDVYRAAEDDAYVQSRIDLLDKYNLKLYAISNHLKGQAVCDNPIDFRHQAIVGAKVWGDGDGEGVRQRAAEGTAVPHLRVGQELDGLGDHEGVVPDEVVVEDVVVGRHRTDHDGVAVLPHPAERLDLAEVDDHLGGV